MSDRTYGYLLSNLTTLDVGGLEAQVRASAVVRTLLGSYTDATKWWAVFSGAADLSAADALLFDGGDGTVEKDPPAVGSLLEVHNGGQLRDLDTLVDLGRRLAALNEARAKLVTAAKSVVEIDRLLVAVNADITTCVALLP